MSDNVVELSGFMKKKEEDEKEVFDKLVDNFESEKMAINTIAHTTANEVCEIIFDLGIDLESNPDCIKDIIVMIESIKATIYRARGEEYHFHDVSDMLINIDNTEEELADFLYGEE